MHLANKTAFVFCATGALSSAAAAGLSRAGAQLHLAARRPEAAAPLAQALAAEAVHSVDVLDEMAIETALRAARKASGQLDIVFNGAGPAPVVAGYGTPSTQLPRESFQTSLDSILTAQFLTARVAARLWQEWGESGTIVLLTSSTSRLKLVNMAGISAASAAVEGLARSLAAEYGRHGIRVVCVNGTAFPETTAIQETTRLQAATAGIPVAVMAEGMAAGYTLGRGPTLEEFGDLVAFLASDSGAILNSHVIDADRGALSVI